LLTKYEHILVERKKRINRKKYCFRNKCHCSKLIVYWTYTVIVRSFISHFSITKHTQTAYDLYLVFSFFFSVPCLHMPFLVDVYSVYFARAAKINPTSKCPINNDPIFKIQKSSSIAILFFRIHIIFHSGRPACILL